MLAAAYQQKYKTLQEETKHCGRRNNLFLFVEWLYGTHQHPFVLIMADYDSVGFLTFDIVTKD